MSIRNKNNEYMLDIINRSVRVCPDILIENSEEIYHAQLVHAALSGGEKSIFLVSGPSASGKTTTAGKLKYELSRMCRDSAVVSMDNFYKDRDLLPIVDGKPNAEVVESLEVELLADKMKQILKTGKATLPVYDFSAGKRKDDAEEVCVGKNGVLIIEGIHALNPVTYRGIDPTLLHRIYVSPHSGFAVPGKTVITKRELRFLRRLVRDSWSRGSDAFKTFSVWREVCRGEDRYIRPLASEADITIDTTHAYEPAVLKDQAIPLLSQIPPENPYYRDAHALLVSLEEVDSVPLKSVPQTSLLREFLKTE